MKPSNNDKWYVNDDGYLCDEMGECVDIQTEAERIVKAVNDHDINEKARLTLEGLTPGGSEYHKDPARCAEFIQRLKHELVERNKEVVRLRCVVNTHDRAVKVLKDMHRYLSAGPIKLKGDIEHCQTLIESVLTDMEG